MPKHKKQWYAINHVELVAFYLAMCSSSPEDAISVFRKIQKRKILYQHGKRTIPQHAQPKICPHYYEATDGVHVVVVGRCNCAGKLQAGA